MDNKKKERMTTAELAACALMAVVICVCSWISVPAPVPFTMQTFAVFCTLSLLGGRLGLISVGRYMCCSARWGCRCFPALQAVWENSLDLPAAT